MGDFVSWLRHAATGERLRTLQDSSGRRWLLYDDGTRKPWRPESGEWVPDDVPAEITDIQMAKVRFAADVQLKDILGLRDRVTTWLDLHPNDMAQWIEGTYPLEGMRKELSDLIGNFLKEQRCNGE